LKVENYNLAEQGLARAKSLENHITNPDNQLIFKKSLSDLTGEQRAAHISGLIAEIDRQGKRLAERVDISEFAKYRKLIKNFVDYVVSNSYDFNKESSFGARGRHRIFATVKTIDGKLDAMAKEILSGQADNIKILDEIGEIRGLILDMML